MQQRPMVTPEGRNERPLIVGVGSIDSGRGQRLTPVPDILLRRVVSNFDVIRAALETLWPDQESCPLDIPANPDADFYRRYALSFTRSYFYKNLLKCLICSELSVHHLRRSSEVSDLGAGSGAFAAALGVIYPYCRIEPVDYSEAQLILAERALDRLGFTDRSSFVLSGISDMSLSGKHCVASYSVGEAMVNGLNVLRIIEDAASFMLLDSPFIVRGVASYLSFRSYHLFSRYVEFFVSGHLLPMVEGGGGHFSFVYKGSHERSDGPSWA